MKLCVLTNKIVAECLYMDDGLYLYNLSIVDYKKQILKGNMCNDLRGCAYICYYYSTDVIRGKFEQGEESISKDAWYSYLYASNVLGGRFVLGESTISTLGGDSYMYARNVLKERFLVGEEMIKKSKYRKDYENHFNIVL